MYVSVFVYIKSIYIWIKYINMRAYAWWSVFVYMKAGSCPAWRRFSPRKLRNVSNLHGDLIEINMKCLEFITNGDSCYLENPEKMKS